MGSILKASCPCGFASEFAAGGGIHTFNELCNAPAICPNCKDFLVLNFFDRPFSCPNCEKVIVFYDNVSLQEKTKETLPIIFAWDIRDKDKFILPAKKYYCPQCQKINLEFADVGCWD